MKSNIGYILLLALCAAIAGCGDDSPRFDDQGRSVEGTPEADIEAGSPTFNVLNILRATRNKVRVVAKMSRPTFEPAKGNALLVNGAIDLEVYEFSAKEELEKMAATISPDGASIAGEKMQWPGPPHLYKTDRVIIIYFGSDTENRRQLEAAFGAQFAGAA